MSTVDLISVGNILRNKRKEIRKRLEDYADDKISTATLSNIERGLPNVHIDKIRYYAEKLGVTLEEVPSLIEEKEAQERRIKSKLQSIHSVVAIVDPDKALERLRILQVDPSSSHYPTSLYLRGLCYLHKNNLNKAQHYFTETIKELDKYPHLESTNLRASCNYDLSRVFYYKNDLKNALSFSNQGIKSFVPHGERSYSIHSLMVGKAIYLEKLDRLEESLRTVEELWGEISKIKSVFVILNMYEIRTSILTKQKMYHEAIQIANEGIELARINRIFDRSFELWNALGHVYMQLQDLDEAENCILTALDLKKQVKKEFLFITSYTQLGLVYLKQNRWEEAHQALLEAVRIGEKTNDARRYTLAEIVLGDYYQAQLDYSEAVTHYQKALEIAKRHGFKSQEQMALIELGKCWKKIDKDEFVKCIERLFEIDIQLHHDRHI